MEKIEWRAPQYIHTEKTGDWYWIVGIITVTIALISIIVGNLIFALLILVSSFTLSLFASKPPETVQNEIGAGGIKKDETFYPFENLESFWVETGDKYPRLILKQKQKLAQYLVLLIDFADAGEIREFLSQHIPEEKMSESIFEKLLIYFGF
jgi:hypothetical protein